MPRPRVRARHRTTPLPGRSPYSPRAYIPTRPHEPTRPHAPSHPHTLTPHPARTAQRPRLPLSSGNHGR
ncbi:hypothetical protein FYJ87_00025 [Corynebacterium urealyticum]|uniref:Uncharacterized protein n=1 Tax=Corynebacterium urealyticum TaxID=43771 RepID=A0A5D4FUK5_9CORY|nr:hypothetical protein FYJ87_00025 [Corynebacterium urealyticum]